MVFLVVVAKFEKVLPPLLSSLKIDLSSLSRLKNDGSSINHTKVVKNRSGCYWKILQNTFSHCQLNLVREKGK